MSQAKKQELVNFTDKYSKSGDFSHQKQQPKQNHKLRWGNLISAIVRPPKSTYSYDLLGTQVFTMKGKIYFREDFYISHQGKQLYLNVFQQRHKQSYVIVYLHGNTSNRLESITILKNAPDEFAVASFDFMGCGNNSDQDTITLGYREAAQTRTITNFLHNLGYKVILWGRSMGASTAILSKCGDMIVADSAYASFKKLCKDVAKEYSPKIIPNCLISCFFPCFFSKLKTDIEKRARYNINDLNVLQSVHQINEQTVLIFMSGNNDELVSSKNSQLLYKNFKGNRKHLQIFDGTHNSKRPSKVIGKIMSILLKQIQSDQNSRKPKQQLVIKSAAQTEKPLVNPDFKFNPLQ